MIATERGPVPEYVPTQAEIAAACAEIQATWTDEDFWQRRRWIPKNGGGLRFQPEVHSRREFSLRELLFSGKRLAE